DEYGNKSPAEGYLTGAVMDGTVTVGKAFMPAPLDLVVINLSSFERPGQDAGELRDRIEKRVVQYASHGSRIELLQDGAGADLAAEMGHVLKGLGYTPIPGSDRLYERPTAATRRTQTNAARESHAMEAYGVSGRSIYLT